MQLATTIEPMDNSETIVKRVSVPLGLEEIMEGLTREVMIVKPSDLYTFASDYCYRMLSLRKEGHLPELSGRTATSAAKESKVLQAKHSDLTKYWSQMSYIPPVRLASFGHNKSHIKDQIIKTIYEKYKGTKPSNNTKTDSTPSHTKATQKTTVSFVDKLRKDDNLEGASRVKLKASPRKSTSKTDQKTVNELKHNTNNQDKKSSRDNNKIKPTPSDNANKLIKIKSESVEKRNTNEKVITKKVRKTQSVLVKQTTKGLENSQDQGVTVLTTQKNGIQESNSKQESISEKSVAKVILNKNTGSVKQDALPSEEKSSQLSETVGKPDEELGIENLEEDHENEANSTRSQISDLNSIDSNENNANEKRIQQKGSSDSSELDNTASQLADDSLGTSDKDSNTNIETSSESSVSDVNKKLPLEILSKKAPNIAPSKKNPNEVDDTNSSSRLESPSRETKTEEHKPSIQETSSSNTDEIKDEKSSSDIITGKDDDKELKSKDIAKTDLVVQNIKDKPEDKKEGDKMTETETNPDDFDINKLKKEIRVFEVAQINNDDSKKTESKNPSEESTESSKENISTITSKNISQSNAGTVVQEKLSKKSNQKTTKDSDSGSHDSANNNGDLSKTNHNVQKPLEQSEPKIGNLSTNKDNLRNDFEVKSSGGELKTFEVDHNHRKDTNTKVETKNQMSNENYQNGHENFDISQVISKEEEASKLKLKVEPILSFDLNKPKSETEESSQIDSSENNLESLNSTEKTTRPSNISKTKQSSNQSENIQSKSDSINEDKLSLESKEFNRDNEGVTDVSSEKPITEKIAVSTNKEKHTPKDNAPQSRQETSRKQLNDSKGDNPDANSIHFITKANLQNRIHSSESKDQKDTKDIADEDKEKEIAKENSQLDKDSKVGKGSFNINNLKSEIQEIFQIDDPKKRIEQINTTNVAAAENISSTGPPVNVSPYKEEPENKDNKESKSDYIIVASSDSEDTDNSKQTEPGTTDNVQSKSNSPKQRKSNAEKDNRKTMMVSEEGKKSLPLDQVTSSKSQLDEVHNQKDGTNNKTLKSEEKSLGKETASSSLENEIDKLHKKAERLSNENEDSNEVPLSNSDKTTTPFDINHLRDEVKEVTELHDTMQNETKGPTAEAINEEILSSNSENVLKPTIKKDDVDKVINESYKDTLEETKSNTSSAGSESDNAEKIISEDNNSTEKSPQQTPSEKSKLVINEDDIAKNKSLQPVIIDPAIKTRNTVVSLEKTQKSKNDIDKIEIENLNQKNDQMPKHFIDENGKKVYSVEELTKEVKNSKEIPGHQIDKSDEALPFDINKLKNEIHEVSQIADSKEIDGVPNANYEAKSQFDNLNQKISATAAPNDISQTKVAKINDKVIEESGKNTNDRKTLSSSSGARSGDSEISQIEKPVTAETTPSIVKSQLKSHPDKPQKNSNIDENNKDQNNSSTFKDIPLSKDREEITHVEPKSDKDINSKEISELKNNTVAEEVSSFDINKVKHEIQEVPQNVDGNINNTIKNATEVLANRPDNFNDTTSLASANNSQSIEPAEENLLKEAKRDIQESKILSPSSRDNKTSNTEKLVTLDTTSSVVKSPPTSHSDKPQENSNMDENNKDQKDSSTFKDIPHSKDREEITHVEPKSDKDINSKEISELKNNTVAEEVSSFDINKVKHEIQEVPQNVDGNINNTIKNATEVLANRPDNFNDNTSLASANNSQSIETAEENLLKEARKDIQESKILSPSSGDDKTPDAEKLVTEDTTSSIVKSPPTSHPDKPQKGSDISEKNKSKKNSTEFKNIPDDKDKKTIHIAKPEDNNEINSKEISQLKKKTEAEEAPSFDINELKKDIQMVSQINDAKAINTTKNTTEVLPNRPDKFNDNTSLAPANNSEFIEMTDNNLLKEPRKDTNGSKILSSFSGDDKSYDAEKPTTEDNSKGIQNIPKENFSGLAQNTSNINIESKNQQNDKVDSNDTNNHKVSHLKSNSIAENQSQFDINNLNHESEQDSQVFDSRKANDTKMSTENISNKSANLSDNSSSTASPNSFQSTSQKVTEDKLLKEPKENIDEDKMLSSLSQDGETVHDEKQTTKENAQIEEKSKPVSRSGKSARTSDKISNEYQSINSTENYSNKDEASEEIRQKEIDNTSKVKSSFDINKLKSEIQDISQEDKQKKDYVTLNSTQISKDQSKYTKEKPSSSSSENNSPASTGEVTVDEQSNKISSNNLENKSSDSKPTSSNSTKVNTNDATRAIDQVKQQEKKDFDQAQIIRDEVSDNNNVSSKFSPLNQTVIKEHYERSSDNFEEDPELSKKTSNIIDKTIEQPEPSAEKDHIDHLNDKNKHLDKVSHIDIDNNNIKLINESSSFDTHKLRSEKNDTTQKNTPKVNDDNINSTEDHFVGSNEEPELPEGKNIAVGSAQAKNEQINNNKTSIENVLQGESSTFHSPHYKFEEPEQKTKPVANIENTEKPMQQEPSDEVMSQPNSTKGTSSQPVLINQPREEDIDRSDKSYETIKKAQKNGTTNQEIQENDEKCKQLYDDLTKVTGVSRVLKEVDNNIDDTRDDQKYDSSSFDVHKLRDEIDQINTVKNSKNETGMNLNKITAVPGEDEQSLDTQTKAPSTGEISDFIRNEQEHTSLVGDKDIQQVPLQQEQIKTIANKSNKYPDNKKISVERLGKSKPADEDVISNKENNSQIKSEVLSNAEDHHFQPNEKVTGVSRASKEIDNNIDDTRDDQKYESSSFDVHKLRDEIGQINTIKNAENETGINLNKITVEPGEDEKSLDTQTKAPSAGEIKYFIRNEQQHTSSVHGKDIQQVPLDQEQIKSIVNNSNRNPDNEKIGVERFGKSKPADGDVISNKENNSQIKSEVLSNAVDHHLEPNKIVETRFVNDQKGEPNLKSQKDQSQKQSTNELGDVDYKTVTDDTLSKNSVELKKSKDSEENATAIKTTDEKEITTPEKVHQHNIAENVADIKHQNVPGGTEESLQKSLDVRNSSHDINDFLKREQEHSAFHLKSERDEQSEKVSPTIDMSKLKKEIEDNRNEDSDNRRVLVNNNDSKPSSKTDDAQVISSKDSDSPTKEQASTNAEAQISNLLDSKSNDGTKTEVVNDKKTEAILKTEKDRLQLNFEDNKQQEIIYEKLGDSLIKNSTELKDSEHADIKSKEDGDKEASKTAMLENNQDIGGQLGDKKVTLGQHKLVGNISDKNTLKSNDDPVNQSMDINSHDINDFLQREQEHSTLQQINEKNKKSIQPSSTFSMSRLKNEIQEASKNGTNQNNQNNIEDLHEQNETEIDHSLINGDNGATIDEERLDRSRRDLSRFNNHNQATEKESSNQIMQPNETNTQNGEGNLADKNEDVASVDEVDTKKDEDSKKQPSSSQAAKNDVIQIEKRQDDQSLEMLNNANEIQNTHQERMERIWQHESSDTQFPKAVNNSENNDNKIGSDEIVGNKIETHDEDDVKRRDTTDQESPSDKLKGIDNQNDGEPHIAKDISQETPLVQETKGDDDATKIESDKPTDEELIDIKKIDDADNNNKNNNKSDSSVFIDSDSSQQKIQDLHDTSKIKKDEHNNQGVISDNPENISTCQEASNIGEKLQEEISETKMEKANLIDQTSMNETEKLNQGTFDKIASERKSTEKLDGTKSVVNDVQATNSSNQNTIRPELPSSKEAVDVGIGQLHAQKLDTAKRNAASTLEKANHIVREKKLQSPSDPNKIINRQSSSEQNANKQSSLDKTSTRKVSPDKTTTKLSSIEKKSAKDPEKITTAKETIKLKNSKQRSSSHDKFTNISQTEKKIDTRQAKKLNRVKSETSVIKKDDNTKVSPRSKVQNLNNSQDINKSSTNPTKTAPSALNIDRSESQKIKEIKKRPSLKKVISKEDVKDLSNVMIAGKKLLNKDSDPNTIHANQIDIAKKNEGDNSEKPSENNNLIDKELIKSENADPKLEKTGFDIKKEGDKNEVDVDDENILQTNTNDTYSSINENYENKSSTYVHPNETLKPDDLERHSNLSVAKSLDGIEENTTHDRETKHSDQTPEESVLQTQTSNSTDHSGEPIEAIASTKNRITTTQSVNLPLSEEENPKVSTKSKRSLSSETPDLMLSISPKEFSSADVTSQITDIETTAKGKGTSSKQSYNAQMLKEEIHEIGTDKGNGRTYDDKMHSIKSSKESGNIADILHNLSNNEEEISTKIDDENAKQTGEKSQIQENSTVSPNIKKSNDYSEHAEKDIIDENETGNKNEFSEKSSMHEKSAIKTLSQPSSFQEARRTEAQDNSENDSVDTKNLSHENEYKAGPTEDDAAKTNQAYLSEHHRSPVKDTDKFYKAAIKIQALFRGFQVRKHTKTRDVFGNSISSEKQPKEVLADRISKHKNSAVKIQKVWRGYNVRKNIKDVKKKFAELQTDTDKSNQKEISDMDIFRAASKIQAAAKGYMIRKDMRKANHLLSISEESSRLSSSKDESVLRDKSGKTDISSDDLANDDEISKYFKEIDNISKTSDKTTASPQKVQNEAMVKDNQIVPSVSKNIKSNEKSDLAKVTGIKSDHKSEDEKEPNTNTTSAKSSNINESNKEESAKDIGSTKISDNTEIASQVKDDNNNRGSFDLENLKHEIKKASKVTERINLVTSVLETETKQKTQASKPTETNVTNKRDNIVNDDLKEVIKEHDIDVKAHGNKETPVMSRTASEEADEKTQASKPTETNLTNKRDNIVNDDLKEVIKDHDIDVKDHGNTETPVMSRTVSEEAEEAKKLYETAPTRPVTSNLTKNIDSNSHKSDKMTSHLEAIPDSIALTPGGKDTKDGIYVDLKNKISTLASNTEPVLPTNEENIKKSSSNEERYIVKNDSTEKDSFDSKDSSHSRPGSITSATSVDSTSTVIFVPESEGFHEEGKGKNSTTELDAENHVDANSSRTEIHASSDQNNSTLIMKNKDEIQNSETGDNDLLVAENKTSNMLSDIPFQNSKLVVPIDDTNLQDNQNDSKQGVVRGTKSSNFQADDKTGKPSTDNINSEDKDSKVSEGSIEKTTEPTVIKKEFALLNQKENPATSTETEGSKTNTRAETNKSYEEKCSSIQEKDAADMHSRPEISRLNHDIDTSPMDEREVIESPSNQEKDKSNVINKSSDMVNSKNVKDIKEEVKELSAKNIGEEEQGDKSPQLNKQHEGEQLSSLSKFSMNDLHEQIKQAQLKDEISGKNNLETINDLKNSNKVKSDNLSKEESSSDAKLKKDTAATMIQSLYRGHRVRRDLDIIKNTDSGDLKRFAINRELSAIKEEDCDEKLNEPNAKGKEESISEEKQKLETQVFHEPTKVSANIHQAAKPEITNDTQEGNLHSHEKNQLRGENAPNITKTSLPQEHKQSATHEASTSTNTSTNSTWHWAKMNEAPSQENHEDQETRNNDGNAEPQRLAVQVDQPPAGIETVTSERPDDDAQMPLRDDPARGISEAVQREMEREKQKHNNAAFPKRNMEQAATKIQAGFRGYQVRKQLRQKNTDAPSDETKQCLLQDTACDEKTQRRSIRRKSSGRLTENNTRTNQVKPVKEVEEKSAVKIQAGIRGFLVRRRQKKMKPSE